MKDSADAKLDRLFAAARSVPPDTACLEEHFETRVLARIQEERDQLRPWFFWLARLIPVFSVLLLVLGIVSLTRDMSGSRDLFAAITGQESMMTTSYLVGE